MSSFFHHRSYNFMANVWMYNKPKNTQLQNLTYNAFLRFLRGQVHGGFYNILPKKSYFHLINALYLIFKGGKHVLGLEPPPITLGSILWWKIAKLLSIKVDVKNMTEHGHGMELIFYLIWRCRTNRTVAGVNIFWVLLL